MKNENEKNEKNEKNISIEDIKFIGEANDSKCPTYKTIAIGDQYIGKTAIIGRIIYNKFIETDPTISLDVKYFQYKIGDKRYQIQFWDTCGQDDFVISTNNLFNNVSICMILYSIVDKKSFEHVNSWLNILRQKSYGGLVYLIATKFDLEDDRVVQKAEGEKLAKDLGFNFFIETSSKNSYNLGNLKKQFVLDLYKKESVDEDKAEGKVSITMENLSKKKTSKKENKCC